MATFSSSSLTFSDSHKSPRHIGKSKQDMTSRKMFGKRFGKHGKDFRIGRKFGRHGKDSRSRTPSSKGISPSVEEFDDWMNKMTRSSSDKKKMFSRKQYG